MGWSGSESALTLRFRSSTRAKRLLDVKRIGSRSSEVRTVPMLHLLDELAESAQTGAFDELLDKGNYRR